MRQGVPVTLVPVQRCSGKTAIRGRCRLGNSINYVHARVSMLHEAQFWSRAAFRGSTSCSSGQASKDNFTRQSRRHEIGVEEESGHK